MEKPIFPDGLRRLDYPLPFYKVLPKGSVTGFPLPTQESRGNIMCYDSAKAGTCDKNEVSLSQETKTTR